MMSATPRPKGKSSGFSEVEKAAMKQRAAEARADARKEKGSAKAEADRRAVVASIAEMPQPDRGLAERVHEIVTSTAPHLAPRTWYGMPAYALDGKIVCFFQSAAKFESRYATFGFNDSAQIDDGHMWPTSYALTQIGDAEAAAIEALVRKAVG
ncbi:iron chaperone [Georgenia yuyongxinii]